MLSVFVSYCCHNKLPQTYWLKATPTYLSVCRPEAWIQRAASFWRLHCVLVAQLCLTLCDPMDCSTPGSSVHGISQARIPEWVAIPSSRGSSWPRDRAWVSCIAGRFFTKVSISLHFLASRGCLHAMTHVPFPLFSKPGIFFPKWAEEKTFPTTRENLLRW